MDVQDEATVRDTRGRFVPGQSGNPAGKRPGTVHRATVLKAALRAGEAEAAARVIIDKAVAGSVTAARFVLDRIDPKPRGRPVEFDVADSADGVQLLDAASRAVANGEFSVDEGRDLLRFIKDVRALRPVMVRERQAPAAPDRVSVPAAARPWPLPASTAPSPAFHLHSAGGVPSSRRCDLLAGVSLTAIAAAAWSPSGPRRTRPSA